MTLAATGLLHPVAAALLMFASSATVLTVVNRPLDRARFARPFVRDDA